MRITGGILCGREVKRPPGVIRPAMDMMRESVFGVLSNQFGGSLEGLSFLDLFTGSGTIALEAASRGASEIEAVEGDAGKRKILLENIAMSPVRIACHFISVELYIKRARRAFDIIFCDPPFPYKYKSELVQSIAASPLMAKEGSLLLIHRPDREKLLSGDEIVLKETRKYGRSEVDFFKKN
ncbi:MAG: RsmD family RNA methyltransferase [Spirochaetaceae bacterium]|jgi:16S rRNA (guanine(966)-N(2))-methyltransferase RsmD|nr:RsmD family RNA methyltransferase [Spirochaetaceae bacterium]